MANIDENATTHTVKTKATTDTRTKISWLEEDEKKHDSEKKKEKDAYQHGEHTPLNRVSILQLGAYAQMTQPHRNDHIGTYQTYVHHTRNEQDYQHAGKENEI